MVFSVLCFLRTFTPALCFFQSIPGKQLLWLCFSKLVVLIYCPPFLNAASSAVTECSRKHYALEHYFLIVYLHKWSINIHSTDYRAISFKVTSNTSFYCLSVFYYKRNCWGGICGCCYALTCVSLDPKVRH